MQCLLQSYLGSFRHRDGRVGFRSTCPPGSAELWIWKNASYKPPGDEDQMNPDFEIVDYKRFRPYLVSNGRIETLYTGTLWGEGPVWFADTQILLWSDIPNDRI